MTRRRVHAREQRVHAREQRVHAREQRVHAREQRVHAREVGIGLAASRSLSETADFAERVEALGFDVFTVFGDLGFQPPVPVLLAAARTTRRIRLGPSCLNPYTAHPIEVAGQIAALDLASDGRAYLGLARGAWLERLGLAQERPLSALRDTAEIVRRLLAGDDGGYAGRAFRIDPGVRLRYPVQRSAVPLLLGGWGPRITALAGEIADELKLGGSANPELVRLVHERLRGSRPTRLVVGAVTVLDTDGPRARSRARREAALYLDVVGGLDPTAAVDPELLRRLHEHLLREEVAEAGDLISDDLLDRFALAGTPDQVAEHVAALFDAGSSRIEFGPPLGLGGPAPGAELLSRRVLPALRH